MTKEMLYFSGPLYLTALVVLGQAYGNEYIGLWLSYVLFSVAEFFLPHDHYNFSAKLAKKTEDDKRYLIPLYAMYVLNFVACGLVFYKVSMGWAATTPMEFILSAFTLAHGGTLGLIIGHELLHRK